MMIRTSLNVESHEGDGQQDSPNHQARLPRAIFSRKPIQLRISPSKFRDYRE
jgi:hypothetical protein